jgi:omega-amidase
MKDITVAIYQMEIIVGQKQKNLEKLEKTIKENSKEIDLWVVPELFTTGFAYSKYPDLGENLDDSYTREFLEKLSEKYNVGIAGTFLIKNEKNQCKNLGFIISPSKGLVYKYPKINLWGNEKEYFIAGTKVPPPVDFEGKAKIGLSICYDLRFPEVSRSLVLQGAEVLITTAAWPDVRASHYRLLAAARALENTSYHIAVNRTGLEKDIYTINYSGSSRVIDPLGTPIVEMGDEEGVVSAKLTAKLLKETREYIPVLTDRKDIPL